MSPIFIDSSFWLTLDLFITSLKDSPCSGIPESDRDESNVKVQLKQQTMAPLNRADCWPAM
jgi:hypothetical protein